MSKKDYSNWTKEELIKRIGELERRKKYGLVWEEKSENVAMMCKDKLPILKEVKSRTIITDKSKSVHLLIEGDNYHALSVLNYTHAKRVDVIYIDPPYNTGQKDFVFNDNYVDKEDAYRHSKWLSFMAKRLKLAKNLLKPTGLIFVSIDDNEYAQLKVLMDESGLFGERNFRNSIIVSRVKKNIQERTYVKTLNLGHGYVLFYANPKCAIAIPTKYQKKAERWHAFDAPGIRETMDYELFGQKPPPGRHWMFTKTKAEELIDKRLLRRSPKTGKPQYKLNASTKTNLDTNWTDLQEGSAKWKFENGEKNPELIKRLLSMSTNKNSVVLDFFAGSGTTAQSVLELNKEDGGERQFILCTNNENGICTDFCYPRIKKIITGYRNAKGYDVAGLGGNIKYYETDFVDAEPTDKNKMKLTKQAVEMLCVKEGTYELILSKNDFKVFKNNDYYTGILHNQLAIPKFKKAIENIIGKFSVYIFSLSDETFDDEFADLKRKVKLSPIPEVILRVYRRIFRET